MNDEIDRWELRKPNSSGGVVSSLPFCGYDKRRLKQIRAQGYRLYKNGKYIPLGKEDDVK